MVFSQNAYVLNDSKKQGHTISIAYDEDTDSITFFVDGKEKSVPMIVPDWANAQPIFALAWPGYNPMNEYPGLPSYFSITRSYSNTLDSKQPSWTYIVPQNGYIQAYACHSGTDYYVTVNGHTAWHKCGSAHAENGFFSVRKGDVVKIIRLRSYWETYWEKILPMKLRDLFYFIPAKKDLS